VVKGTCNPKLLAKADELLAAERQVKGNAEFDEKTQAAIKLSMEMTEEIKTNMATKEGLSHLEEITQTTSDEIKSSVSEINEKMKSYQIAFSNQAVTIANLNESLIINDRKMMNLEKQNESQRFIIAKLNDDMRKKEQLILHLTQQNQALLQSQGDRAGDIIDQIKTLLAEQQEATRKRKHDE